jgi:hypothetical protein
MGGSTVRVLAQAAIIADYRTQIAPTREQLQGVEPIAQPARRAVRLHLPEQV